MPFNCQPPSSLSDTAGVAQPCLPCRTAVRSAPKMLAWLRDVQRRRSPVAAQIVAVHDHLRLVLGLRAGQRRSSCPGSSTRCNWRGTASPGSSRRVTSDLQRVVAAVAFGEPEEARAESTDWAAWPTGIYCAPCGTRAARRAGAAGLAAGGIGADLRRNAVGIDAEQSVISERSRHRRRAAPCCGRVAARWRSSIPARSASSRRPECLAARRWCRAWERRGRTRADRRAGNHRREREERRVGEGDAAVVRAAANSAGS